LGPEESFLALEICFPRMSGMTVEPELDRLDDVDDDGELACSDLTGDSRS